MNAQGITLKYRFSCILCLFSGDVWQMANRWLPKGTTVRHSIGSVETGRMEEGYMGICAHWRTVARSRVKRRHHLWLLVSLVSCRGLFETCKIFQNVKSVMLFMKFVFGVSHLKLSITGRDVPPPQLSKLNDIPATG